MPGHDPEPLLGCAAVETGLDRGKPFVEPAEQGARFLVAGVEECAYSPNVLLLLVGDEHRRHRGSQERKERDAEDDYEAAHDAAPSQGRILQLEDGRLAPASPAAARG